MACLRESIDQAKVMPDCPKPQIVPWHAQLAEALHDAAAWVRAGRVHSARGAHLQVRGLDAAVGELCELHESDGNASRPVGYAEVVCLQGEDLLLNCLESPPAISRRLCVRATGRRLMVPAGESVVGRVLDGFGRPLDSGPDLGAVPLTPVDRAPPAALARRPIDQPMATGIRAIDALLPVGKGQRLAILAPAGTGKSRLLVRLARNCPAERVVVALVGERGREVAEFVGELSGAGVLSRSVVVAASADRPAIERVKCALTATAVAESFRARGQQVLLLVDSLTRWVQAHRDMGLAALPVPGAAGIDTCDNGALAALLERAGNDAHAGISACYTVLCDESVAADPTAEQVRAITDGHIQLSRSLANRGLFPAIDVLRSVSRLATGLVSQRHERNASELRAMLARLEEVDLLLKVGEYRPGADKLTDRAIQLQSSITQFLFDSSAMADDCAQRGQPGTAVSGSAGLADIDRALHELLNSSMPVELAVNAVATSLTT